MAAQQKLELSVRMGIATGEAELREGDYFGSVLNRAARVMATGTAVRSFWPSRHREVVSARSGVATETPSFDHAHGLPLQLSIQAERGPDPQG